MRDLVVLLVTFMHIVGAMDIASLIPKTLRRTPSLYRRDSKSGNTSRRSRGDKDETPLDELVDACKSGDTMTVAGIMFQNHIDLTANGFKAIKVALKGNHVGVVRELLSNPEIAKQSFVWLYDACAYASVETVQLVSKYLPTITHGELVTVFYACLKAAAKRREDKIVFFIYTLPEFQDGLTLLERLNALNVLMESMSRLDVKEVADAELYDSLVEAVKTEESDLDTLETIAKNNELAQTVKILKAATDSSL